MISRVSVILAVVASALGSQSSALRAAPPPDPSLRRSSDDYGYREERDDDRGPRDAGRYDRYGDGRYSSWRRPDRYGYARMANRRYYQPEEVQRPQSYDGPPSGPDSYRYGRPPDGPEGYRYGPQNGPDSYRYGGPPGGPDGYRYGGPPQGDGPYMDGPPADGPYDDGPGGDFYHGDPGGYYDDCCDGYYDNSWASSGPIYVRGEYLLWWLKGDSLPPLVTTSPQGTPRSQAGVLGHDNTTVLFGDGRVNSDSRSGGRIVLGWWADSCTRIEGEWFGLAQASSNFSQSSSGDPILARPFFNLTSGAQDANVLAFPGQLSGNVGVAETSSFWGAAIRATYNLVCCNNCDSRHSVDFVYGYRYMRLRENLTVDSSAQVTDPQSPLPVGTTFASSDSFTVSNNFNGGLVGLMASKCASSWTFVASGRLGIGGTWERVTINGSSTATLNGQSTTTPGGLLAMPTNIGSNRNVGFSVLPELELKLGYNLTPTLRFLIGYDVMYWSRVVRPGDQVDTFVNTSQSSGQPLVGTPGPLFAFRQSDLWVQGLSIGGEWCW